MAGNTQLYALLFFGANGTLFAEEEEIDTRRTAGAQRVFTVMKGLAGLSPGAALIEVTVRSAVPNGGFEFDMGKFILGYVPVNCQVWGPGGTNVKASFFIEHDSLRHGVNQPASYSFDGVAPMALFS